MTVAYGDIARVLDGARRRKVRVVVLATAGLGLAVALLVLLLGAVALSRGARIGIRPVVLALAVTALAAAIAVAVRALRRTAWTREAAARAVAREDEGLRSDLVSSVELARERDEIRESGRFSVALVDAHLERTAGLARGIDLAAVVPDLWARRGATALAAVAALSAASFLVGGRDFASAYRRIVRGDPPGTPAPAADPITGDIELTYAFPAYMRREPRTLSGTGGEVHAPKGTEVSLRTRGDRPVKVAEIAVQYDAPVQANPSAASKPTSPAGPTAPPTIVKRYALTVNGDRDLSGRFLVTDGGSYRFRFLDGKGKVLAEGPPIPIQLEPDAPPTARVLAPDQEIEVDANEVVRIEWQAEDDFGLSEVALVTKPDGGTESRRVLAKPDGRRRDAGTFDLDLKPERLAEGERLSFWLEAVDTDTVSGPKKGQSETHVVKIYSEAEHRRQVLEKARQAYEEMIALLGDRLDTFAAGPVATPERLPTALQLDTRTRHLHERMREVAGEIRRDPAGPREVAAALVNTTGALRLAEARVSNARGSVAQAIRVRIRPDGSLVRTMGALDGQLDAELEKGILYLEQLLDKRRAEDLVRLAKDLGARRRDLANLMEKYRKAPTDQGKKELLAQIGRMKERVRDLLSRMAELSKGFNDEHMNAEALAELAKSKDLVGGLDEVEKLLAQGDVEGAMKALDRMASTMDEMVAGLERTAGRPDEKQQALMKEMLAFKEELEKVKAEQEKTAGETEQVRGEYRKKLEQKMKGAEAEVKRLEQLAKEARQDVESAQPGITYRAEIEYEAAREALVDLERALGMKELGAALETAQRAAPSVERLARYLDEDAELARESPIALRRDAAQVQDAQRKVDGAVPKAREIRDQLSRMFPDPRQVLGQDAQKRLQQLAQRQAGLEKRSEGLQQRLSELSQQAPIFPPDAQGQLGESTGHMGQAATELGNRNPQRGHGEQELAMDALARFQKGLEEAARKGKGGGQGQGFPFPFAESGGRDETGEGREASRERVKIPGAEAYRVPEEFRRDLLDAMKAGTPERYKSEVQRYYEELVK